MYFSEIYSIFFLDIFFHFLYLFKMWEIFMPHSVVGGAGLHILMWESGRALPIRTAMMSIEFRNLC
jgi:hypothetical protein